MYIHNYGTEQLWTCICDKQRTVDVKLQAMVVFLKRIGIKNISEKTAGAATSLCRTFTVLHDDTPDKALASARKLKDLLRVLWKDSPVVDIPTEYPPTPQEFLVSHPLWYALRTQTARLCQARPM